MKEDLRQSHGIEIARSHLKSLGDTVGSIVQAKEECWEYAVPKLDEPVSSVAVGLDGTCMLLAEDGWREAMVGTLSLYDRRGERRHTIQIGATPEYGKQRFLARLNQELDRIKSHYPQAIYVGIADGAAQNWSFLKQRTDRQTLDFFHASGYLGKAADIMFSGKAQSDLKSTWLDTKVTSFIFLKHCRTTAGTVAAMGIARQGLSVLLVDRASFPRHKLCGACLNGASLSGLSRLGLETDLRQLGGFAIGKFQLRSGDRQLELNLPSGLAVTRRRLDAMLVEAAIAAGADFLPATHLTLEPAAVDGDVRHLTTSDRAKQTFRTRVVVLSTGLAGERRVSDADLGVVATAGSRIGAGTTTEHFPEAYSPGTIFMAVGTDGYVGLTRTEGHSLNIAAALDCGAVRASSPADVCSRILVESGFPSSPEMFSGEWRGTIGLTRHRRAPAASRVFVIGDAAGYVEPFTGEGMAWAIRGGELVLPYVVRAATSWNKRLSADWCVVLRKQIGRRQRWCRILAKILRYPLAVRSLIRIMAIVPSLGQAVVSKLNQDDEYELLDSGAGHSSAA